MLPVLLRHKVRFVILGGYGAMVHRVEGLEPTTDIDICPLLDDANLARLRAALDELGAEPFFGETARPTSLRDLLADRERLEQTKAVMLVTEWGALDLVIRPDGISRGYRTLEPAAAIRPAVDAGGNPVGFDVPVASLRHIYISKRDAGRPKDIRALRHLARALVQQVRRPGGGEGASVEAERLRAVEEAGRSG
ncbi:MAG: hypothetical protein ACRD12_16570, partial [Acidimicrobiales bacterium]